ncbi:MAG TPA: tetratricopeptide repeat protein, partial [Planctomycetaceae bacterium]|nr:tetratricopeptide repeat protein [Planctomycetaceae bacterium]
LHESLAKNKAWSKSAAGELAGRYLAATHANIAVLEEDRAPEAARRSYARALEILRSLAKRLPNQTELSADLALTCNNLGAMQSRLGEHTSATESYRESVELLRQLVASAPMSIPYRRDLALSLNNRGLALARDGRSSEAEHAFQQAAEVQQALVTEHPENLHDVSSLGGIWNNLGMMREGQRQPARAIAAYEQALQIQQSAMKAGPPRSRDYLDRTLVNFSRVCREQGLLDRALQLTLQRRDLWPDQPDRLWSVAVEFAEIAKQDARSHDGLSTTRRELLQLAADTVNAGVRGGLNRNATAKSAVFQELIGDDQFRAMLGWSDWQDFATD